MLIGFILGVLVVGLVFLPIPKRIYRVALQNGVRLNGTRSPKRIWQEVKHFVDLSGALLLILVFFTVITGGTIVLVHYYVVPLSIVVDVFSVFDVEPVQWEANMEEGQHGDIGVTYEQWSQEEGFSEQSARFWQEFLWKHWITLAIATLILGGFFYWLIAKFYTAYVVRYGKGVIERKETYYRWDTRA